MNFAYTQYEPMLSDSAQSMMMTTEATFGVYVPMSGAPVYVEKAPRSDLIKLVCDYCAVRHLFDREKEEESLKALICLGCGAPLPLPKD